MKKRDHIQEIKSIKSRTEFNSRYDFSSRLLDIERALEEFTNYNGDFNNEILKYIPISTVACFEAFFRSAVKEIIDFGKPFSDNVIKFNESKNVKLNFDILSAIQTKTLTVGEFVAHLIPFNNYDDINSNLSLLIDRDFTDELKKFDKDSLFRLERCSIEDFTSDFPKIIESVKRTYDLRHIFCHEFATNLEIDRNEILLNFKNCKLFLEHTDNVIWEILYPNSPKSQTEMNISAYESYELKDNELEKLILAVKKFSSEGDDIEMIDEELFNKSIEKWKEYRTAFAEYQSGLFVGGSIYGLYYSSALEKITCEKIESLENEFEILLRRNQYA